MADDNDTCDWIAAVALQQHTAWRARHRIRCERSFTLAVLVNVMYIS